VQQFAIGGFYAVAYDNRFGFSGGTLVVLNVKAIHLLRVEPFKCLALNQVIASLRTVEISQVGEII
jgi:hypothetical protein